MAPNRQPGGLAIAADLERRAPIRDAPASGMAEVAARAAGTLAQLGGRIGEMADKAAAAEGADAGRLAGIDPEFRPKKTGTIYGDAFDRAGLQVAESRTRQAMLADLDGVADKHQGSPGDLKVALDQKRGQWLAGAIPELRPDLEISWDGASLAAMRTATRAYLARVAAEQQAALQGELEGGLKALHQKAFALGLDATADEALTAELGRIDRLLARADATGKRLVEPAAAAKIMASLRETVNTGRIMGTFERLPGEAAKQAFIDDFEADFAASRNAAKAYNLSGFEAVRGHLRAELRRAATERAATARAVLGGIRSVAERAKQGFAAPPEEMAALEAQVAAAADPALAAGLAEAKDVLAFQGAIRSMAPAELDATVRAIRAQAAEGGASEALAARIAMADGVLDTMRRELEQDQLGWAERVGRISAIVPLDLSTPEAAAATLRARMAQSDVVGEIYGRPPQDLQPHEVRALAVMASKGGKELIEIATAISGAAGERAPRILAQVFPEAPTVAVVGSLAAAVGVSKTVEDAAAGIALRKTDGFQSRLGAPGAARRIAHEMLGTTYAAAPDVQGAVINVATAIYEMRAAQRGMADFDDELWKGAVAEATGARVIGGVQYGGLADVGSDVVFYDMFGSETFRSRGRSGAGRVLVPSDVRADGFGTLLSSVRLEDLAPASRPFVEGKMPAAAADLRRAIPRSVGNGQYWLSLGDPDGVAPDWLVDADGDRYVLDLEALKPVLKQRRPDLYLGGR